jgi:hypothetical protein
MTFQYGGPCSIPAATSRVGVPPPFRRQRDASAVRKNIQNDIVLKIIYSGGVIKNIWADIVIQ